MKNVIFFLLGILYTCSLYADSNLNSIQNEILVLKSSINYSEKQIHMKSKEYKLLTGELKVYEDKIQIISNTLYEYKQKIKNDYLVLQKNWNVLLMQQADANRHVEYLVTHKGIIETMKLKSDNLRKNIIWATSLESDLALTRKENSNLKVKSEVLIGLIQRLEDDKLRLLGKVNEKKSLGLKEEHKIINYTLESKLAKGEFFLDASFILPIGKFAKLERSEHGLNFYYKEHASLIAPASGKVIYVGELSNYGNVIMIEHDRKMISVLLGEIRSEVEEASLVTQGSVIGKLLADRDGGMKSLYYEIRKEERPVPTLSYLKIKN